MVKEQQTEKLFDRILIRDFLRAIDNNDPEMIGVSEDELEAMAEAYMDKPKKTQMEKRADHYRDKAFLVRITLFVLTHEPADEEMMQVLRDQGYKIERDTYFQDIKKIAESVKFLDMQFEEAKDKLPKKEDKKVKRDEKFNTFDILTSVATGLELSLDFSKMVVNEFLSYKRQLTRKVARAEKKQAEIKSKRKHGTR